MFEMPHCIISLNIRVEGDKKIKNWIFFSIHKSFHSMAHTDKNKNSLEILSNLYHYKVAKISTSAGEARISLKSLPESLEVFSRGSKFPETVTITGSEFVAEV